MKCNTEPPGKSGNKKTPLKFAGKVILQIQKKQTPSFWPPKKFTVFAPHLSACQHGHAIEQ